MGQNIALVVKDFLFRPVGWRGWIATWLAASCIVGFIRPTDGDSIRLHDQTEIRGPTVTLAEVAELDGSYARSWANHIVGAFGQGAEQSQVTLAVVQDALDRAGVNWGRLSLGGHDACNVRLLPSPPLPVSDHRSPVIANYESEIGLSTPTSVRDLLIDRIEKMTGKNRSDLRIMFANHFQKRLDSSAMDGHLEIDPLNTARMGRMSFRVNRYRHGRMIGSYTITASVAHREMVLVVMRSIRRGEVFTPDMIMLKEHWLDRDRGEPLNKMSDLLDQFAAKMIPAGTVIYPEHIRVPILVRRGELVTVRCFLPGVLVRTVATAREDGAMGDQITVRNEKTRESFSVTVSGQRKAVVVDAARYKIGSDE